MISVLNNLLQYFYINDELISRQINFVFVLILLIPIVKLIQLTIQKNEESPKKTKNLTNILMKEKNISCPLRRPRSFGLSHDELEKNINDKFIIRKIKVEDFKNGFLSLLNQLSDSPDLTTITENQFKDYLKRLDQTKKNSTSKTSIYVIHDEIENKVVSTGTIIFEQKFLHCFETVAHIEDVVVSKDYRGKGLGRKLINYLIEESQIEKCYKVILNCKDENIQFYEKCNFKRKGSEMGIYFKKY